MRALEIFEADYTPELFSRTFVYGNRKKQSPSLFNLCNLCRSVPGRQMLRYPKAEHSRMTALVNGCRIWFEQPLCNREVLTERQDGISFFLQDCNMDATGWIRSKLGHVSNIRVRTP